MQKGRSFMHPMIENFRNRISAAQNWHQSCISSIQAQNPWNLKIINLSPAEATCSLYDSLNQISNLQFKQSKKMTHHPRTTEKEQWPHKQDLNPVIMFQSSPLIRIEVRNLWLNPTDGDWIPASEAVSCCWHVAYLPWEETHVANWNESTYSNLNHAWEAIDHMPFQRSYLANLIVMIDDCSVHVCAYPQY